MTDTREQADQAIFSDEKWGFPARHGESPRAFDGFCERENPNRQWMMTKGVALFQETPKWEKYVDMLDSDNPVDYDDC